MSAGHLGELTLLGGTAIAGHYFGQLSRKLRLPSVVGCMVMGVLVGPSLAGLLNEEFLFRVSFITDIVLGFVAFSIGAELRFTVFKRLGLGIVAIILGESFAAFLVVFGVAWLLTRNLPLALVFGAVAPASAPAGTVAVIQETGAKGNLTKALYAVVGFDDGLAIVIFGFAAALAKVILVQRATGEAAGFLAAIGRPCLEIVGSLVLGAAIGFIFAFLVRKMKTHSGTFVLLVGVVFITTGLATRWHLSLILANMAIGMVLANTRRRELAQRVTEPLREFMPLLFIFFFTLAGAHLQIGKLPQLGFLGIAYILARSGAKIGGAWLGAHLGKVEPKIKKFLGLGILSQAGVAIGLSLIVLADFRALNEKYHVAFAKLAEADPLNDPAALAGAVVTTVTATCIVFEIIGPILTKYALSRAEEIPGESGKVRIRC